MSIGQAIGKRASLALRLAFAVYLFGLIGWLLLGLLPTLAADSESIRNVLASIAAGGSALAAPAARVLATDAMGMPIVVPSANVWLQYAFSLLNLALGCLLAFRRLDHLVPRLLAFALLGTAATFNDASHQAFHITGSPWPIAMAHFTFHVVSGVAYFWAVVLFPNGSPPRRLGMPAVWRQPAALMITTAVVLVCYTSSFLQHPQFFVVFFGIGIPLAGVAAQAVRLTDEHTPASEKAIARLLCAALLPALAAAVAWLIARALGAFGVAGSAEFAEWVQSMFPVVFAIVPVVLCAGALRYRLWDVDRLLVRMLAYGLIAISIGAVYGGAVLIGVRVAGSGLWWLVVTIAVAAVLVEPLRVRANRWANRVVYGQVLSPAEAMRSLVGGLEQLSAGSGLDQIALVTVSSTRALAAALWLIDVDRLVPTSGDGPSVPLSSLDLDLIAEDLGVSLCWPVLHQDETLGVLAVTTPPDTVLSGTDRALITDVAAHAGLLVHNALLSVRLVRHIDDLGRAAAELRDSRRAVVAAQDAERRRLERDLHDGAQQAVVAAIIGLKTLNGRATEFDELQEVLAVSAEVLSDLTGQDRPSILVQHGLAGALAQAAALAGRAGLQVDVKVELGHRPDADEWATAVYFCCSEALQNVLKYANATRATVEVLVSDAGVDFEVTDNGSGFAPAESTVSTGGLPQLAGRCVLLGGRLSVDSAPAAGARVRGRIPFAQILVDA